MNKKIKNKGFTLTELIVVIVIIGILAAVLIPTLTGYINKAKISAAEQEATSYITYFNTWQLESEDDIQDLDSFKEYCIEMGVVSKDEVDEIILDVAVEDNKIFTIKASNGYYVTYLNGKLSTDKESPTVVNRKKFHENFIEPKVGEINALFPSREAELIVKPVNDDGSYDVDVKIIDENANPESVVAPVTRALEYIKEAGGQSIIVCPIINGEVLNAAEYKIKTTSIFGENIDANQYFPLDIQNSSVAQMAMWAAFAITYDDSFTTLDEWNAEVEALLADDAKLSSLLQENGVRIYANITDQNNATYTVVYNFNFMK